MWFWRRIVLYWKYANIARRDINGAPMPTPNPRAILPVDVRDVDDDVEAGSEELLFSLSRELLVGVSAEEGMVEFLDEEEDEDEEEVMLKLADVYSFESSSPSIAR